MGQDCASWRGDLGAYLLGALDEEEGAAMRAHLAGCAACRREYEYLLPVHDWLAGTRQHLATCRACRTDYREFLPLRSLTAGPQPEDRGDGHPRGGNLPKPRRTVSPGRARRGSGPGRRAGH